MKIALTGATGFIGRYIVRQLVNQGHELSCWHRAGSDLSGFESIDSSIHWVQGGLLEDQAADELIAGCDAVVHAAFWRPGPGFRGAEGDVVEFAKVNILGTLDLIEAGRRADVKRFVYLSTCAVHEHILKDRPLDEAHPLWPLTHYGAHKAAIEKFVHSYGLGLGFPICALRPTGVYGVNHPIENTKWFGLVEDIVEGRDVQVACSGFNYSLNIASDYDEANDNKVVQHGVDVVVDKKSSLFLEGTTVDYYEGLEQRGFQFHNPNAKKTCGCGSSFSV